MGAGGAAHSAGQARRQQADGERARSRQWPDVCPEHRLPVAGDSQGPATALDSLRLFRSVGLGRYARSYPRRALPALSRGGLARSEPHRRHHRQPERQERGKRGACIDPPGYDAGKKIKGKKRHVLVDTQRAADARDRACRRRPGSRRRRAADGEPLRRFPVPGQALCRRRLSRAAIPERDERHSGASTSRSSNDRIKLKASSPYPSAGSSNAPSPGSAAAADWPRIGNASTARRSPSCASPPFASCCESYAIPRDVLGQTLRFDRKRLKTLIAKRRCKETQTYWDAPYGLDPAAAAVLQSSPLGAGSFCRADHKGRRALARRAARPYMRRLPIEGPPLMTDADRLPGWHATTVLMVRKGDRVVIGGDGQVSMGQTVVKANARKVRRLAKGEVIAGFAGATADAFTLF